MACMLSLNSVSHTAVYRLFNWPLQYRAMSGSSAGRDVGMRSQVALAYQAKERELLAKEAAIYTIFMYDGKVRGVS